MKIYAAINAIQKDLNKTGITKSHTNKQQGYNFRGIDDVYNILAPLLATHGVCILPRVLARTIVERKSNAGGALFSVCVESEFDFVCAEDGSKHIVKVFGEAMDSGDKATNKALSAAYKYACIQTFAIPTQGDNDIDATTHEVEAQLERNAAAPSRTYVPSDSPKTLPASPNSPGDFVRFIPKEVIFVAGKGKGANKTFSKITSPDGTTYDGNELQGQIAEGAKNARKEVVLAFTSSQYGLKATHVKLNESQPDPEPQEIEVGF